QGADSIFLTGHPPHGTKPDRKRGSRILKNRPRRHRDLMPATGTLPASRSQRPRFGLAAARTAKPFWPAQAEQIVPAVLLAAESSFEFRQCPRIVLLQLFHKPPHYLLWLPESSGYPNYTNSTTVTIATPAITATTTAYVQWGTDNTAAIQAAIDLAVAPSS